MLKYLLIFLILTQSCYALSLDLNYSTMGPEQNFLGHIQIPEGTYNSDSKIKLSTKHSSDSEKLKDVLNCDEIDCTKIIDYYVSTDSTEQIIEGSNILTGIRVHKDVTSITDASFDIENSNLDYPDTPSIDIGDDNNPEWIYPGQATETFSTDFSGPQIPTQIQSVEIQPSGNCQKLLLRKSTKYEIQAYTKQASTLDLFIKGLTSEVTCSQSTHDYWDWTSCTLNLEKPLETGYYYVCVTSPSSGNLLASNITSKNPQGYANCLIDCQPVDKDYIIQVKEADYITKLTSKQTYSQSNTREGEYLYLTLSQYFRDCIFYNNYCTIPIRVTSKNNKGVKLSNLEYKTKQVDVTIQNQFLSTITKVSGEEQITLPYPIQISLSEFDTGTPSELGNYELKVEFNNEIEKLNYNVVEIPTARISISKERASVFEQISFDASKSSYSKEGNLEFTWDFGDNTTDRGTLLTHTYIKPGTYTVTLIAIDTIKNISSLPVKSTIEIFSSETQIKDLLDSTLNRIERAIRYMNSANLDTKEIYTDLKLDIELSQAKSNLLSYKNRISTLTEQQIQELQQDINEVLSTKPYTISILQTLDITPYLGYDDIDKIYPDESSSFKETIRNINSKISKQVKAKLIRETHLSDDFEDYILVKKIITPNNPLKDVSIIEAIPLTLSAPEFLNQEAEITTSRDYLKAEILANLDYSTILLYKIPSSEIALIKDTKTIILPENLKETIIAFECGNNICNPGEDYVSCPEDCHCGNKICEANEDNNNCPLDCKKTSWLLITLFLLFLVGISGAAYFIHKNPSFAKKIKIEKLLNKLIKFLKRNPFSSETELKRITKFIKNSKEKGYPVSKIRKALSSKGWSQAKIKYALKKLR